MHLTIRNLSRTPRLFVVCIHDATPAYARETQTVIRDLAPLVGRHLTFGVVPNWHGEWPLTAHPNYCRLLAENSEELLLHGYCHRRERGWGAATWLAEGCDEMNGLDPETTRQILYRGQRVFSDVFGVSARGFIAPGWQRGHVRAASELGLEHVVGFFSLESRDGRTVSLATSTWDCGRWGWLGHVGHGIGSLLQSLDARVPVIAIHPRDLERGFWPKILGLTETLIRRGYEPTSPARLLGAHRC